MVTAILPDVETAIKTLTRNRLGEISSDVESEPVDGAGAIVIRISLDGNCSVQILADASTEEKELRELFMVARPAIEWMQMTVHALHAELVGLGG